MFFRGILCFSLSGPGKNPLVLQKRLPNKFRVKPDRPQVKENCGAFAVRPKLLVCLLRSPAPSANLVDQIVHSLGEFSPLHVAEAIVYLMNQSPSCREAVPDALLKSLSVRNDLVSLSIVLASRHSSSLSSCFRDVYITRLVSSVHEQDLAIDDRYGAYLVVALDRHTNYLSLSPSVRRSLALLVKRQWDVALVGPATRLQLDVDWKIHEIRLEQIIKSRIHVDTEIAQDILNVLVTENKNTTLKAERWKLFMEYILNQQNSHSISD
jgi:hypothetical protein